MKEAKVNKINIRQRDCDRLLFLLDMLRSRHDHPDAQECHRSMKESIPSIGLSTVYRHLSSLVKDGLINEIKTDDGLTRYDATTSEHGHFMCMRCNKIMDVMPLKIDAQYPGTVQSTLFIAKGICKKCLTN